jgi:hypothetical protein
VEAEAVPIAQILYFFQFPVCLYLGYLTAKRHERSMVSWIGIGAVASVLLPPVGFVIMLVAALWMPPPTRKRSLPPEPEDRPGGRRRPTRGG